MPMFSVLYFILFYQILVFQEHLILLVIFDFVGGFEFSNVIVFLSSFGMVLSLYILYFYIIAYFLDHYKMFHKILYWLFTFGIFNIVCICFFILICGIYPQIILIFCNIFFKLIIYCFIFLLLKLKIMFCFIIIINYLL